jgi:hypothetical protein
VNRAVLPSGVTDSDWGVTQCGGYSVRLPEVCCRESGSCVALSL